MRTLQKLLTLVLVALVALPAVAQEEDAFQTRLKVSSTIQSARRPGKFVFYSTVVRTIGLPLVKISYN